MKYSLAIGDKAAVTLSALCTVHCLLLPLAVALLPALAALPLQDEIYHIWMVVMVVPLSAYTLTMGCKKHKNYRVMALGAVGVLLLIAALVLGHDLGEFSEKALTVLGSLFVAGGHVWNYRLCQKSDQCGCDD